MYLQQKREKVLPILSIASANILWGLSFLFTKNAIGKAPSMVYLSIRFSIAFAVLLMAMSLLRQGVRLRGKSKRAMAILAFKMPVYYFLESTCIALCGATMTALFLSLAPIASLILAYFLLGERPGRAQAVYALVPIPGVLIITGYGKSLGGLTIPGVLLLLLTTLWTAYARIASKKYSDAFSSFERTFLGIGACCGCYLALCFLQVPDAARLIFVSLSDHSFLLCVLVLGVLCSLGAELISNYAIPHLPARTVSSFSALKSLTAMLAGVLLLREPFSLLLGASALLILFGVYKVSTT